MMLRFTLRVAVVSLLFALATWQFGWISIPVVGLAVGLTSRIFGAGPLSAAIAAALAWGIFLGYAEIVGDNGAIAALVAGGIGTTPAIVLAAMLMFPALLALSSALIGVSLARLVR